MKLYGLAIGLCSVTMMACSPTAKQIKEVMQKNPDILHAAIEADPKGFFETVQAVQGKAREQSMSEQMDAEFKRVLEEMKTPKDIQVEETRATLGPADAKITIVEWADFNCGHCRTAAETMEKIAEEYKDSVRVVFKHLPILAKESRTAAEYMEAIALQDKSKALKFHTAIFQDQGGLREGGEGFLKKTAKSVGADVAKVQKDSRSDAVKKIIENDLSEAKKFEFNGTPGFMVNGASIHGAYPYDFFKKVIDHILGNKPT